MFLFTQMAGHSVLNQPKLRALRSQQRYLARSVWYKRKIIQQAGISPSYFRPRWVGWFGFGHFHYLLALKPKLVKEGSLKISTHWYWSARLMACKSVTSPPHLHGHSVTARPRHPRACVQAGQMEQATAAAGPGPRWRSAGNRNKPDDGIFKATAIRLLLQRKHLPYQESCVTKSWSTVIN